MSQHPARQHLRALLRQPATRLDVVEAALCIAWEDQNQDARAATLGEIAALADAARPRLEQCSDIAGKLNTLNDLLFAELGFRGNAARYNDPANSFLDQVVARRTGLPITLSMLYIVLGERLGLPIYGVALPGHFLTRCATPNGDIYIDPFNRGKRWTRAECEAQIVATYHEHADGLIEQMLAPPSVRAILTRMLRNLKYAYVEEKDFAHALAATERLLLLEPDNASELRDCGLLRASIGQLHRALEDLDRYAQLAPAANDLPIVRLRAQSLAQQLAHLS